MNRPAAPFFAVDWSVGQGGSRTVCRTGGHQQIQPSAEEFPPRPHTAADASVVTGSRSRLVLRGFAATLAAAALLAGAAGVGFGRL